MEVYRAGIFLWLQGMKSFDIAQAGVFARRRSLGGVERRVWFRGFHDQGIAVFLHARFTLERVMHKDHNIYRRKPRVKPPGGRGFWRRLSRREFFAVGSF
jgi:hypothetical protein